jgi:alpha-amylase/alpha-mannosidase (GH57 family)
VAREGRLALCFGVHDHQPVGNFDEVVAGASARAYRPFFELVRRRPDLRLTIHVTGSLLEWLRERIDQGTALLIAWRFGAGVAESEVVTRPTVANR